MAQYNAIPTVYNPLNTSLLIAELEPTDYAEGTKVVVSKNSDLVLPNVGVNGEVALAVNQDRTGTLTFSVKNTSPFNEIMTGLVQAQQIGNLFFPVQLREQSTEGFDINSLGWVQTQPDYTLGQEIGQLDWVIGLVDATSGNFGATGSIISSLGSDIAQQLV